MNTKLYPARNIWPSEMRFSPNSGMNSMLLMLPLLPMPAAMLIAPLADLTCDVYGVQVSSSSFDLQVLVLAPGSIMKVCVLAVCCVVENV